MLSSLLQEVVKNPVGNQDYVAWFQIGWLRWKYDGNVEEAEEAFARAARLSSRNNDAYYTESIRHQAYIWYLLKDYSQANLLINKLPSSISSSNIHIIWDHARYAALVGDKNKVTALIKGILQMMPNMIFDICSESDFAIYREEIIMLIKDMMKEMLHECTVIIDNNPFKTTMEYNNIYADYVKNALLFIDGNKNVSPTSFLEMLSRRDEIKNYYEKSKAIILGATIERILSSNNCDLLVDKIRLGYNIANDYSATNDNVIHKIISLGLGTLDVKKQAIDIAIERGVDINKKGTDDNTPLHLCALYNDVNIAQHLLLKGADPNHRAKENETPLFTSIRHKSQDVMSILLSMKSDVNAKNAYGQTPIDIVISIYDYSDEHDQIINVLLKNGAKVEKTLLQQVKQMKKPYLYKLLLKHR